MSNVIIKFSNISASYSQKKVLQNVSLNIYEDDFLGIIGPNGGGKTTLIKVLLGILKPTEGSLSFFREGKQVEALNFGYLPQINQIDKMFPISVFEVLSSGLNKRAGFLSKSSKLEKQRIEEIAEQMGVSDLLKKPIGKLSGGQLQRVLVGRAIITKPEVLILDEPNTYIDKAFETKLYPLLKSINKETAIILISHDVGTVLSCVKNIACINEHLHYHAADDVNEEWLNTQTNCPIELLGHGDFPHRILKKHSL